MESERERGVDVWEKWDWLWTAIFYLSAIVSAAFMLLDDNRAAPAWAALLLTGVLLLWHWAGMRFAYRDGADWNERTYARLIVILGDVLLWFVLVTLSPAYYILLFGLFGQVFRHLPIRYAIFAAILLALGILFEQVSDSGASFSPAEPLVWVYLIIGLACILLGVWVAAIIGQSTRRRELIEQLEAAQAELAAAERREGVLEERQRLAREIHDTLAQGFTSIVMNLEAAEQALPDDLPTLQKHLDQARGTARSSLDQARRVVQDLRPDLLEEQSLPPAIERTAERWEEETGIPVTTAITGAPSALHPDVEVTLLRAAQEALNNIRKHAQATAVQLTLSYMGDVVILDVQDNGLGLDGAEPSALTGGYGLQAMRERAELCGGSLTLESDKGEGTTVVVSIPV
jgi:signal transduction histidine kinase